MHQGGGDHAQADAAQHLAEKHDDRIHGRRLLGAEGDRQTDGEDDHADAVVEQGLAVDDGLQTRRQPDLAEDRQRRDRVGRRDQRAEDQGKDQPETDAEQAQQPPDGQPRQHRADQRGTDGQHQDDPLLFAQDADLHIDAAGEQHEAEHAVEQGLVQREVGDEGLFPDESIGQAKGV